MKKIGIAFAVMLSIVCFGVAFADDGAATFKTRCQACHGQDGGKVPPNGTNAIKGQSAESILTKLQGYKAGSYGGKGKQVMAGTVKRLSDDQMKGVADYASKL